MAVEESPYGAKVSWTMLCVPEGSLSISSHVSRTVASYDSLEHVLAMDLVRIEGRFKVSYASLLAPTYPPRPMEMAPAASSARPPRTTTFVLPRADKPADRAKGTVNPSDKPRMASEMTRGLMRERVVLLLLVDPSLLTQRPKVS